MDDIWKRQRGKFCSKSIPAIIEKLTIPVHAFKWPTKKLSCKSWPNVVDFIKLFRGVLCIKIDHIGNIGKPGLVLCDCAHEHLRKHLYCTPGKSGLGFPGIEQKIFGNLVEFVLFCFSKCWVVTVGEWACRVKSADTTMAVTVSGRDIPILPLLNIID